MKGKKPMKKTTCRRTILSAFLVTVLMFTTFTANLIPAAYATEPAVKESKSEPAKAAETKADPEKAQTAPAQQTTPVQTAPQPPASSPEAAPAPAAETKADPAPKTVTVGTVKATNLHVRTGPATTYDSLGMLPNGTVITITKTENGWHYASANGLTGWVCADFVVNVKQVTVQQQTEISRGAAEKRTSLRSQIAEFAKKQLGKPYVSGAEGPNGFDCSGLTTYVFSNFKISVPRVSTSYTSIGKGVSIANARPGDIVCFDCRGKIDGGVSHVGIYLGDKKFIHAASSGSVRISSLTESYYSARLVTIRNILD